MALIDSTPLTRIAAGDLTGSMLLFGKETATGFTVCDTLGERTDGVIGNEPKAAGHPVEVYRERQFKVIAGATFAAGTHVTTAANGRAVAAAAGQYIAGVAVNAGVDGRVIEVTEAVGAFAAA